MPLRAWHCSKVVSSLTIRVWGRSRVRGAGPAHTRDIQVAPPVRCSAVDLDWGGLLQHTDQQINALLHHRSRFQVAAPHLAGPIGEAEVKVHTTR